MGRLEARRIIDGGYETDSRDNANAGNSHEAAADIIPAGPLLQLPVRSFDFFMQRFNGFQLPLDMLREDTLKSCCVTSDAVNERCRTA